MLALHEVAWRGDVVTLTGEMRRAALRGAGSRRPGGEPIVIEQHGPGDPDPRAALRALEAEGFAVVGEPRRKPKHFEITGRDESGALFEFHIGFDGTNRGSKSLKAA